MRQMITAECVMKRPIELAIYVFEHCFNIVWATHKSIAKSVHYLFTSKLHLMKWLFVQQYETSDAHV